MSDAAGGPAAVYGARLGERRAAAAREARRESWLSNARLVVFAAGLGVGWLAFGAHWIGGLWLLAPVAVFGALAWVHDRVIRARERADRGVAFYERGLARLGDAWAGGGEAGERFRDPRHPYAEDLDLFGEGSLFELLCTARTRAGEECLAGWLKAPAHPEPVAARQAAVEELRPGLDLREDLARVGEIVRGGLHPELLERWAGEPAFHGTGTWRLAAGVLALLALAAAAGWILLGAGPLPLVAVALVEGLVALRLRGPVRHVLGAVERPARELELFGALLERLEAERFAAPRLAELHARFETDGAPASRELARLRRLIELADARRNQLFAPIAVLLLWGVQFGLAIEAWRQRVGRQVPRWLEAVGEIEALVALASHAWEHPADRFPELASGAGPRFEARALGHPLLPEGRCVRNDVALGDGLHALVVSGSNMSGKSTLLRTVGVNAVLAQAGAPVRAERLVLSPLAVGASIRLHDSLQEGSSRFYAEILRLRQIVDLAGSERRALFLLDEILHGTNSHDRRIGASALVARLVETGAIGLVTTHDLALARIAEELAPRARNVHFEDHIEEGRIRFDYRLRPGVVTHSNALALMREVGLEV